jgi:hypothetical protein
MYKRGETPLFVIMRPTIPSMEIVGRMIIKESFYERQGKNDEKENKENCSGTGGMYGHSIPVAGSGRCYQPVGHHFQYHSGYA